MKHLMLWLIVILSGCSQATSVLVPKEVPTGTTIFPPPSNARFDLQPLTSYRSIYSFRGDENSANPVGHLATLNGVLYGLTYAGGISDVGTVFTVSTTGKEHLLYSFQGGTDGANPVAGLTDVNGTFYGTTENGGTSACSGGGCGTVFKVSTSGAEQVVYAFKGGADGIGPTSDLTLWKGTLFGTTQIGGASNFGIVYAINPSGTERVLYSFKGGTDGADPWGRLIYQNGALYGTTQRGGGTSCFHKGCGTVFKVSTSGVEQVLYRFKGQKDGSYPIGGLLSVQGALYGTTYAGGVNTNCGALRCGTIFTLSASGKERVLYRFKGGTSDGAGPQANLIFLNGELYGTTVFGGGCYQRSGCGTVFKATTSGAETRLYAFKGVADGSFPAAGLTDLNGALYGTTPNGGSYGSGIVFALASP